MGRIIKLKSKGEFKFTNSFFNRVLHRDFYKKIEEYAQLGVEALSSATPIDTGETASSWSYDIFYNTDSIKIEWYNSSHIDRVPIAILLQYGHATRNGNFILGLDFINPAIKPIFHDISESVWEEVTKR